MNSFMKRASSTRSDSEYATLSLSRCLESGDHLFDLTAVAAAGAEASADRGRGRTRYVSFSAVAAALNLLDSPSRLSSSYFLCSRAERMP